ncbi:MAG TPA: FAD/NAD(P)-binding oxidoreductase, partial [Enhygromyxa sp.]|nr:FAD/NAD(P)-binding oxidoreductase [Enhygromyxa sp.]
MADHHSIVIVGGGTAGITVAARLLNADPSLDVAIIEPSETHYYQPLWTLVGGGQFSREITARSQADYIPPGATWVQEYVEGFAPEQSAVILRGGKRLHYDQLVVCAGIQLDWSAIEGLPATLGRHGVCSNYSYDTVAYTWECISTLRGGRALFTAPAKAIKCGGAPQKIMWLAEENFRKRKVRDATEVSFAIAGPRIFGVEKYRRTLERLVGERAALDEVGGRLRRGHMQHRVVELDGAAVGAAEGRALVIGVDGDELVAEVGHDVALDDQPLERAPILLDPEDPWPGDRKADLGGITNLALAKVLLGQPHDLLR